VAGKSKAPATLAGKIETAAGALSETEIQLILKYTLPILNEYCQSRPQSARQSNSQGRSHLAFFTLASVVMKMSNPIGRPIGQNRP
jgi:hypothetical protein